MFYRVCAIAAVCVAVLSPVIAGNVPDGYVKTPNGWMPKECVHAVPNGASINIEETHAVIVLDDVEVARHEHCTLETHKGDRPLLIINNPSSVGANPSSVGANPLPPDYDGWVEYTADTLSAGFNTFNGYWSVPDSPVDTPDQLFVFTGLQNINWIPKVDPFPSTAFDIIQPVTQYPADDPSNWGWSVKSWYVTLNSGAFYSDEVALEKGEKVYGVMQRMSTTEWLVSATGGPDNKTTSIRPNHPRLSVQPWAYTTIECYGCTSCKTYSQEPIKFTGMSIKDSNNNDYTPKWLANPKPAAKHFCNEGVKIDSPQEVIYSFQ